MFYTFIAARDGIPGPVRKPNQAHLRAYGCKVFAMTNAARKGRDRLQKLNPRAWIGYLIGYRSTNIFEVWLPHNNEVIYARDVLFNEQQFFDGNKETLKDDLLRVTTEEYEDWVNQVRLPEAPQQSRREAEANEEEDEELSGQRL